MGAGCLPTASSPDRPVQHADRDQVDQRQQRIAGDCMFRCGLLFAGFPLDRNAENDLSCVQVRASRRLWRRLRYAPSRSGRRSLQGREVVHEQPVEKHVAAAELAQQDALRAEVKEAHVVPAPRDRRSGYAPRHRSWWEPSLGLPVAGGRWRSYYVSVRALAMSLRVTMGDNHMSAPSIRTSVRAV